MAEKISVKVGTFIYKFRVELLHVFCQAYKNERLIFESVETVLQVFIVVSIFPLPNKFFEHKNFVFVLVGIKKQGVPGGIRKVVR